MNNTRQEFEKRISEIDNYFKVIKLLDLGRCKISCINIDDTHVEDVIDNDLSKIFKANGFLLLYNLIEATVRNSIQAIFTSIREEKLVFEKLTENLKDLWFNQELKSIYLISDNGLIKRNVREITEKLLNNQILDFGNDCVNISGNIDASKIREIAKKFGYESSNNGEKLVEIKNQRNKLAHGEYTFSEIGKNYTANDLMNYKNETKEYLDDVLNKIEEYLKDKKYREDSISLN